MGWTNIIWLDGAMWRTSPDFGGCSIGVDD